MAATISFWAGETQIQDLSGSGLGFYGDGFGQSVSVGSWQDRTYITNSAGTTQGPEARNVKYLNSASGILGQTGSGLGLTAIPNYQATLNIRFTNDSAVKVQTARLRIYDRVNIDNDPSGAVVKVAEIIHPDTVQNNNGSGSSSWETPAGSGSIMSLSQSPGTSGHYASATSEVVDSRHDWYLALSANPSSIGSKSNLGLYVSVEYL